jgi:hypothetical protein
MLGDFFLKKSVAKWAQTIGKEKREKLMELLEKDPDFFAQVSEEVERETAGGALPEEAVENAVEKNYKRFLEIFKESGIVK